MSIRKPTWFSDDKIMVSTAPTCGLTKGGRLLPLIDANTGKRVQATDPETGATIDAVDDKLKDDVVALINGERTETLNFIDAADMDARCAVPCYYDFRYKDRFDEAMRRPKFSEFGKSCIGDMISNGLIEVRNGHGSPSQDERVGNVPYIKVSDLRAGLVNINPTNRIPLAIAKKFWRGESSGLRAFDVVSPERTSKNIGDFCVLLPGQEQVVMTKEVIVFRPGPEAIFDSFYLLWALSLQIVRDQWRRVIFMQTNREDVGKRYYEIFLPVPPTVELASKVSEPFRTYYRSLAEARFTLSNYLNGDIAHHFFVGGSEELAAVSHGDGQDSGN